MRLLQLFPFSRKLSPAWTYAPGAAIWRMLPTSDGVLVGESRDEEKKQVRFFCIDLRTGTPAWENRSVGEEWWVGIEAVHDTVAFLHLFARPDMPEHAGLVAIDRESGEVLWKRPDVQLRAFEGSNVIVRDVNGVDDATMALDVRTGEDAGGAGGSTPGFTDPEGIMYPMSVQPGQPGWEVLLPCLHKQHLVGMGEGVSVDDRWIFSYHASDRPVPEATTFEHRLVIVDGSGRLIYTDILHKEAHMPVYDAFFVREGHLFYIRQERELVCVKVSAS